MKYLCDTEWIVKKNETKLSLMFCLSPIISEGKHWSSYQLFHERALDNYELAITNLISNKREWNNCFIKKAPKI